eukprot:927111-Pyramimonas_sp.AAC.1
MHAVSSRPRARGISAIRNGSDLPSAAPALWERGAPRRKPRPAGLLAGAPPFERRLRAPVPRRR